MKFPQSSPCIERPALNQAWNSQWDWTLPLEPQGTVCTEALLNITAACISDVGSAACTPDRHFMGKMPITAILSSNLKQVKAFYSIWLVNYMIFTYVWIRPILQTRCLLCALWKRTTVVSANTCKDLGTWAASLARLHMVGHVARSCPGELPTSDVVRKAFKENFKNQFKTQSTLEHST